MRATGGDFSKVTMEVISRTENGILMGGVVYENYTGKGGSVIAHIAKFAPNWITRDFLWMIFDYPFRQLDCNQVINHCRAKNADAIQLCKSMGGKEVAKIEAVFPDDDVVILSIKRQGCRFLDIKPRTIKPKG